jgi:hypothetical protein
MPAFQWPAGIGALHVICCLRLRAGAPSGGAAWSVPHGILKIVGGAVAVFVVLSANEIFGMPPLMTPRFNPSSPLVGTWEGSGYKLTIDHDGSVAGIDGGRVMPNRSWFGELMHWRSEYMLRGNNTIMPLDLVGSELRGGQGVWMRRAGN